MTQIVKEREQSTNNSENNKINEPRILTILFPLGKRIVTYHVEVKLCQGSKTTPTDDWKEGQVDGCREGLAQQEP